MQRKPNKASLTLSNHNVYKRNYGSILENCWNKVPEPMLERSLKAHGDKGNKVLPLVVTALSRNGAVTPSSELQTG